MRETADGELRIRPPELHGDAPEESDRLRFPLLVLALLSIAAVIALAQMRHGVQADAASRPLSADERSRLPELLPVPSGGLPITPGLPDARIAAFRISRTEVTVEQFRLFVKHSGYTNPRWKDFPCVGGSDELSWDQPGYDQADTYPVVCVSAADAQAFAAWMSKQTGLSLRLPTELEWEFAARGGSRTRYWWGDNYESRYADCADCGARVPEHPGYVGARPANAYGLVDVAGNVREWTCTPYVSAIMQPPGRCAGDLDEATNLVVRGGSWQEPGLALQSSHREPFGAWHRNVWTGFRIVAELVSQ